jgi:hypothetical protein
MKTKKILFNYDFIINLILSFFKIYVFLNIIFLFSKYNNKNKISNFSFNKQYIEAHKNINMTFHNKIQNKNKIKIAIYTHCIKNGGRARVTTLLLKYLFRIKIFNLFLFTRKFKEDNEYFVPEDIKRVIIKKDLIKTIKKNKIDILIYELDEIKDILLLNHFTKSKVIFYHHSSTFDWLYENYIIFKKIYKSFYDSKYVVSIVPFENDYLFKKWGIRSILMDNFITYEFKSVIQTDLTSKIIIMLGRANSKKKRFILGMQSMEYIIKEIPECKLKIISNRTGINKQEYFVENTNLENNIKFIGYIAAPDIIFKNASLSFFPSITEAFPMVLVETKIYGIPNILLGLDYISISKGGTVIIYDDTPESLAKEAITILKIKAYKRRLNLEARNSMRKFNNEIILLKWVKLILSVYNDDDYYYINLREEDKKINEKQALKIIKNQLNLLKKRNPYFLNISSKNYENYTWMEEIKFK